MSEERFIGLETRLAHQDQLLNQLNDVVTEQQAAIMRLEALCKSLIQRVQAVGEGLQGSEPGSESGNEPPPHY